MNENSTKVYEFESDKVQTISLEDLSSSLRRESGLAGIRGIPKQVWTFIAVIRTMLSDMNINYVFGDIHVQNNSSKAYLTDGQKDQGFTQKNAPIDRWRFDKVIQMIQLPNILSETKGIARNAAIGITLNKEGLSVAFGMNVHECSNFNVMGGTLLRSYSYGGREAMPWELMEFKIRQWLDGLSQIWGVQNQIMEDMMGYSIPADIPIVDEIIGDLYTGALKQAYFKGPEMPFNTHELSEFVQTMIKSGEHSGANIKSVWDVYNWGTSIMKPGKVDIGEIANSSNLWADYLMNRFELGIAECEILD